MNVFVILALATALCSGNCLNESTLTDSNWENVPFGGFHPPKHDFLSESTEPRIIGGVDAVPHAYPYQISLQIVKNGSRRHICGGSILSSTKIACAAHCCVNQNVTNLLIVAGAQNMKIVERAQQRVGVSKLIVHPLYNRTTADNDACKIILKKPLVLNRDVATILLCSKEPADGIKCTASGWGLTDPVNPNASLPDALQVVNLEIVSKEKCIADYSGGTLVTRSMLCAGSVAGKGGCNGDSGGPLKCNINGEDCLAGCTSWGDRPCAQAKPTVYVNVATLHAFYKTN